MDNSFFVWPGCICDGRVVIASEREPPEEFSAMEGGGYSLMSWLDSDEWALLFEPTSPSDNAMSVFLASRRKRKKLTEFHANTVAQIQFRIEGDEFSFVTVPIRDKLRDLKLEQAYEAFRFATWRLGRSADWLSRVRDDLYVDLYEPDNALHKVGLDVRQDHDRMLIVVHTIEANHYKLTPARYQLLLYNDGTCECPQNYSPVLHRIRGKE